MFKVEMMELKSKTNDELWFGLKILLLEVSSFYLKANNFKAEVISYEKVRPKQI